MDDESRLECTQVLLAQETNHSTTIYFANHSHLIYIDRNKSLWT